MVFTGDKKFLLVNWWYLERVNLPLDAEANYALIKCFHGNIGIANCGYLPPTFVIITRTRKKSQTFYTLL